MGLCTEELSEDLRRVNTLLTQLQYSRITAQELTDGELRARLTESLTEAIGALRKCQEEMRLGLLRSIVKSADTRMDTGVAATNSSLP